MIVHCRGAMACAISKATAMVQVRRKWHGVTCMSHRATYGWLRWGGTFMDSLPHRYGPCAQSWSSNVLFWPLAAPRGKRAAHKLAAERATATVRLHGTRTLLTAAAHRQLSCRQHSHHPHGLGLRRCPAARRPAAPCLHALAMARLDWAGPGPSGSSSFTTPGAVIPAVAQGAEG